MSDRRRAGQSPLRLGPQLHEAVERIESVGGALGVDRLALLTNNPDRAAQLAGHGLDVVARVPTAVHLTAANRRYLSAKAHRGSHALELGA